MAVALRAHPPEVPVPTATPISNARLGILLLIAAEAMLFGGLIGAHLVFRFGSRAWPPPGLPNLPVFVTLLNTIVLLASGVPLTFGLHAIRRGDRAGLLRGVGLTAALGLIFLLVQGEEWVRLIGYGLRVSSGPYGSTFYTLVGFHGLHVLGAVVWLGFVLFSAARKRFTPRRHAAVELVTIYWYFVIGVWAVLFPLVYLGLGK